MSITASPNGTVLRFTVDMALRRMALSSVMERLARSGSSSINARMLLSALNMKCGFLAAEVGELALAVGGLQSERPRFLNAAAHDVVVGHIEERPDKELEHPAEQHLEQSQVVLADQRFAAWNAASCMAACSRPATAPKATAPITMRRKSLHGHVQPVPFLEEQAQGVAAGDTDDDHGQGDQSRRSRRRSPPSMRAAPAQRASLAGPCHELGGPIQ